MTVSSEIILKGLGFARYVRALAASRGKHYEALAIASRWKHSTPRVLQAIEDNVTDAMVSKALRDPGTVADVDWAGPLTNFKILVSEFIAMLRSRTVLGRLENVHKVPLGVRFLSQSAASTVGWIGEGVAAPVGEMSLATVVLGYSKAAGILVVSQELLDASTPDAEALFSSELRNAMAQFFDEQFINPAIAAVANVSPASITNGATVIASSGTTIAAIVADFAALFAALNDNNINLTTPTLIMHPKTAIALALKRDSASGAAFSNVTAIGGTLFGVPVLTSSYVSSSVSGGAIVVLVDSSEIIVADPGLVTVDASRQAAVQMRSDPQTGAQQLTSLWQQNFVGIRCVRYGNWKRRRDKSVAYIDGVFW